MATVHRSAIYKKACLLILRYILKIYFFVSQWPAIRSHECNEGEVWCGIVDAFRNREFEFDFSLQNVQTVYSDFRIQSKINSQSLQAAQFV